VEDDARRVRDENVLDESGVGCVAEDGRHGAGQAGCAPLALEMVEMALGCLKEQQHGRGKDPEAKRQSRADGAACSRDEHGLAIECFEHCERWRGQPRTSKKAAPVQVFERQNHRCSINWTRIGRVPYQNGNPPDEPTERTVAYTGWGLGCFYFACCKALQPVWGRDL